MVKYVTFVLLSKISLKIYHKIVLIALIRFFFFLFYVMFVFSLKFSNKSGQFRRAVGYIPQPSAGCSQRSISRDLNPAFFTHPRIPAWRRRGVRVSQSAPWLLIPDTLSGHLAGMLEGSLIVSWDCFSETWGSSSASAVSESPGRREGLRGEGDEVVARKDANQDWG